MKPFIDAAGLEEDERCKLIALACAQRKVVAFMVDDEVDAAGEHKADRYVRKIRAADPRLVELDRTAGPVPNVITVRISLPELDN